MSRDIKDFVYGKNNRYCAVEFLHNFIVYIDKSSLISGIGSKRSRTDWIDARDTNFFCLYVKSGR